MTYFYGSFFEWSNIRNIVIDQDGLKYIAPTKKKQKDWESKKISRTFRHFLVKGGGEGGQVVIIIKKLTFCLRELYLDQSQFLCRMGIHKFSHPPLH